MCYLWKQCFGAKKEKKNNKRRNDCQKQGLKNKCNVSSAHDTSSLVTHRFLVSPVLTCVSVGVYVFTFVCAHVCTHACLYIRFSFNSFFFLPWAWRENQPLRVFPSLPEELSSNHSTHVGQLTAPGDLAFPSGFCVHSHTCEIHSHKHTL